MNPKFLKIIGPGILVAATGVGAGDLATGAFTGSKLGAAILWAVIAGAAIKFLINEGLARWQLATGDTLLEGAVKHFGRFFSWLFLAYLFVWSFFVGVALMSACGVTSHAILPLLKNAQQDKILYGLIHSAVAVGLVKLGGFALFEKIMSVCIAVMFVIVVATAIALQPSMAEVGLGLVWPRIPQFNDQGLPWTIALLGGVGGTLTVLCYGYWIREEGRQNDEHLSICRIDLAVGYTMTAIFGLAMVIIGSRLDAIEGGGASLVVDIADKLQTALGRWGVVGRWAFLIGAWGAVFSSLLGVWQSVPYLFADVCRMMQRPTQNSKENSRSDTEGKDAEKVNLKGWPYQAYLYLLATIPAAGLVWSDFRSAQKYYAIIGAMCIPLLALMLLILNGQTRFIGPKHRNAWITSALLGVVIVMFLLAGWYKLP